MNLERELLLAAKDFNRAVLPTFLMNHRRALEPPTWEAVWVVVVDVRLTGDWVDHADHIVGCVPVSVYVGDGRPIVDIDSVRTLERECLVSDRSAKLVW